MEGKNVRRRLTAILAADVAGYSRLMGADEEGTLRRLQAHRRELIDPKIHEHRGRLVKTTGDGMLVEFASVVDAVRCAVEMQRGMSERESEAADDQRIRFRVGINLGDIIIDRDDIFGDGVNVASRLEALAEPGGLCISGTVRDHIGGRLPYAFSDLGEQSVKNIARPVPVFMLPPPAIAATPLILPKPPPRLPRNRAAALAAVLLFLLLTGGGLAVSRLWPLPPGSGDVKAAPRLSIVVLPFANLSSDADQEYFADAITDDLTTDLSRIGDSFVISRTTAFTYKGKPIDVKQIGRDLGVRYVLEGSVRRLGEQVQVNTQLIDAETGAHVWADRFDTDRANLAKAQGEITARLARTLQVELIQAAGRQIEQEKPVNLDARDFVMRGWAFYYRSVSPPNREAARQAFERALAMDPEAADARVGIATIVIENVMYGWSKSPDQDLARADQWLREALQTDRNDWRVHFGIGLLRRYQKRFVESKMEFEETIALDRNSAAGILQLGWALTLLARPEAGLPYFEKALALSPGSPNIHWFYVGLGNCHLYLGHLDEAIVFLRKARASNSAVYLFPAQLAAALALKGDIEGAKAALSEAQKLKPDLRSLADWRRGTPFMYNSPDFAALAAKTQDVGLLRAGLPEE